jgi:hypothetical protein
MREDFPEHVFPTYFLLEMNLCNLLNNLIYNYITIDTYQNYGLYTLERRTEEKCGSFTWENVHEQIT